MDSSQSAGKQPIINETESNVSTPEGSPQDTPDNSVADPIKLVTFSQKQIYAIGVAVVTILLGLLFWQLDGLDFIRKTLSPAVAVITITDAETGNPVSNATLTIESRELETEIDGTLVVDNLSAQLYEFIVTAQGYVDFKESSTLKRGQNNLLFKITPYLPTTDIGGKVYDFIDGSIISGATVVYEGEEKITGDDGGFLLTNVPIGTVSLHASRQGYRDLDLEVQLSSQYQIDVNLVPEGKTFFVSNRDNGKRGIYSANFDGSDVAQLVQRVGDTEDYGIVLSSDSQKVAFLSTRDGKKSQNNNYDDPNLYVISTDGTNLVRVGSHYFISSISWSNTSDSLVWLGGVSQESYSSDIFVFSVNEGKTTKINSDETSTLIMNPSKSAFVWSQSPTYGDPIAKEGLFYYEFGSKRTTKILDSAAWNVIFSDDEKVLFVQYNDNISDDEVIMSYDIATNTSVVIDQLPISTSSSNQMISPDGLHFASVETRDGKSDVYFSNTDGTGERKLTRIGNVLDLVGWHISGKYILFDNRSSSETARYIVGLGGVSEKKVADIFLESYSYNGGY